MKRLTLLFTTAIIFTFTTSLCYGTTKNDFEKYDAQGNILPNNAVSWAMVKDRTTGLFWEVKTDDASIHDKNRKFTYVEAEEQLIGKLNNMKFGGFTDWRMPSNDELYSIRKKGAEPYINPLYFPHTTPTPYHSWRLCGSGEIFNEQVKFGKTRLKGKMKPARAVRGKSQ